MNFFNLDPRQLPTSTLYRIQYDGCMTIFNPHSGFASRDTKTFYTQRDGIFVDFGGAVESHLSWDKDRPSFFISLFADKRHAENWALSWSARHDDKMCEIFKINASSLVGLSVFHAEELWRCLCLHVPEAAEASIADEYLVARRIPYSAVLGRWTTEDVKRGGGYSSRDR